MDAPDLAEGMTWGYGTFIRSEPPVEANATKRVAAIEPVQVGNASFDAYRVETAFGGAREGESTATWYRVSDFAKLRVRITGPGSDRTYDLEAPCREWRFPLEVGARWSTSCRFVTADDGFTIDSNWSVVRAEEVATPAGAFQALVLEQSGPDFLERWWFAPEACFWVKHESTDGAGTVLSWENLTSVEGCAPAAPTPASPTPTSPTPATPTPTSPTPTSPTPTSPTLTTPPAATGATPMPENQTGDADAPGPGLLAALAAFGAAVAVLRRR